MSSSNASMPHSISGTGILDRDAVDERADRRLAHVYAAHQPRSEWTEAVLPLHSQHRARVGVAEVVQARVVRGTEPGQVVPHVISAHPSHGPANDRGDLAFVVQELAVRRTDELAAVAVERRRGLHEVRGMVAFELASELHGPRGVVEVHAHDRACIDGRDVHRRCLVDRGAVFEDEHVRLGSAVVHSTFVDYPAYLSSRAVEHAHAEPFPSSNRSASDRTKCVTACRVTAPHSRCGACPQPSSTNLDPTRRAPLDRPNSAHRAVLVAVPCTTSLGVSIARLTSSMFESRNSGESHTSFHCQNVASASS
jgi:hypothetical protein